MAKKSPITGHYRDKLLVALDMPELLGAVNAAMRVRRAELTLDYACDHHPRLLLSRPGVEAERIMVLDTRKHLCYISPPTNQELLAIFLDIMERLAKLNARMRLTGTRPKQGPRRAALQIHVDGANTIAITLMDVLKGKRNKDTSFQLPDGTTP